MKSFTRVLMALMVVVMLALPTVSNAAMVVADEGASVILGTILRAVAVQDLKIDLYCTDVTPTAAGTDTVSTYTKCTGGGYAQQTLSRGTNWTISGTAPSLATYSELTFTFTGALTTNGTVYGYIVTDAAGTTLMWSEKFGSTLTPTNNGDNIKVTPKFAASKGTPD